MARQTTPQNVTRARRLRSTMSLPEVLLWKELRRGAGGLKFRRQHPAGDYVIDFYCAEAKLGIEIDGIAHDMGGRPERDARRDLALAELGIDVVRIPARDVLRSAGEVAGAIVSMCGERRKRPLHHPLRGRSPSP